MKGNILDTFIEATDNAKCHLAKFTLSDYLQNLPVDYQDYEIQRQIVKNSYLDNIIVTILNGRHIPPIVLVGEESNVTLSVKGDIEIDKFKILDGLQRTYRLKAIWETIKLIQTEQILTSTTTPSKISLVKDYRDKLNAINSSASILFKLIEYPGDLGSLFLRPQWFEIWTGLNSEAEVNKMLVLNAGHKSVTNKHQLEILFRNIVPIIAESSQPGFQLIREKNVESNNIKKDRVTGQFLFSHLITSLLSLKEARPLTTNIDLIQKAQGDYFNDDLFEVILEFAFLRQFISTLINIDQAIFKQFKEEGVKWMGRETSLVGMFAATGKYATDKNVSYVSAMCLLNDTIVNHAHKLNLSQFEVQRNSTDLAKVNIGILNKKAVFKGIYQLLTDEKTIEWQSYFKG